MSEYAYCEKHQSEYPEGDGCSICRMEQFDIDYPEPLRIWLRELDKELWESCTGFSWPFL
jgi:hypothetical protein